jgi:hypothetical protein
MRRQARVRIFTDKNSLDHFRHGQIDFAARPERDDVFFQSSSVSSTRTRVFSLALLNGRKSETIGFAVVKPEGKPFPASCSSLTAS